MKMLKGTKVIVHSIHLHPEDEHDARGQQEYVLKHLPECLYVRKAGALWQMLPCAPLGLYPVKPCPATWYLDKGRVNPQLAIHRRQLPVSPAFAVTIFSLQGGEEEFLEVDVNISSKCSPQTCYVALSRTKSREGLRIMRPFPVTSFQGTSPIGQELLLATLQHDVAGMEQRMAAYRNSRSNTRQKKIRNCLLPCRGCNELVPALTYSQRQLDEGADRRCPTCVAESE